jgi:BA14K-like protein
MTRSGIVGATALSLSLAIAAPALAQHEPGGRAGGNLGARTSGTPQANFRSPQAGANANFRTGQANPGANNFAGRTNAQLAQRGDAQFARPQPGGGGEFRGDRDRRFGRFGRDAGFAAGVVAGDALAYGGYGYGYDPYYYGDTYAYDDGAYYDPGYAVAFDQPLVGVEAGPAVPVVPDAAYCAQRFRSYDPASGTYLGFDGLRHPCP